MPAVGKAFGKGERGMLILGGISSCWGYSGAERWDRSDPRGSCRLDGSSSYLHGSSPWQLPRSSRQGLSPSGWATAGQRAARGVG